jgi:hypothetical protein
MQYTFRLMQESGVQGPQATIEANPDQVEQAAREWAAGQTGHPWDALTIESEDGECIEVESATV